MLRAAAAQAAALAFVLALACAPGTAAASGACGAGGVLTAEGAHISCRYSGVGEDTFSVPSGLEQLSVVAVGAAGGDGGGFGGGVGGAGAVVTAPSVSVGGLATLFVEVGGQGEDGGLVTRCTQGAGGSNGGGPGGPGRCEAGGGAGGAGASDLRTLPATAGGLTAAVGDPRLVVAGGGGGGGAGGFSAPRVGSAGGPSGFSSAGGAGNGGSVECVHEEGEVGGPGRTGAGGGSGGVIENEGFLCVGSHGAAGLPGAGGEGGNGNAANSSGGGGGGGGYVGGGGGATAGDHGGGGGGGSSYGPAGSTFATASGSEPASVTISWAAVAPRASIGSPASGASYALGQQVASSFSCTEGAGGPGIFSCVNEAGAASGAKIDTATAGQHTFTVTATSADGLRTSAAVPYTVSAPAARTSAGGSSPPAVPAVAIRRLARTARNSKAQVTLACTAADCSGKLSLAWLHPRRGGGGTVTTLLARISYTLSAGRSGTFAMPLAPDAMKLLRRAGGGGREVRVRATTQQGLVVRTFARLGL